jgi:hypothetical protein
MNDDKLYTAETLGAMVLLERFMYPCRLSKPKEVVRHQLGIRHVMKQIGPPNPDDDLHSWLVRGSVNTMVSSTHPSLPSLTNPYRSIMSPSMALVKIPQNPKPIRPAARQLEHPRIGVMAATGI